MEYRSSSLENLTLKKGDGRLIWSDSPKEEKKAKCSLSPYFHDISKRKLKSFYDLSKFASLVKKA